MIVTPQLGQRRRPAFQLALAGGAGCRRAVLPARSSPAQFSAGTELVEVYVSVSDAAGRPVIGLAREAFTVLEDGAAQQVTTFAAGTMPLALGVADRSELQHGRASAIDREGRCRPGYSSHSNPGTERWS